jgi:putative ABC transport system substrate-binding protein
MNNRRRLIVALGAGAFAGPLTSLAQPSGNMSRIGLLWIDGGNSAPYITALRDGLRAQGYVEGKNIRIDDHSLVDRYELLPQAASKLVSEKVDIIVCYGATAIEVASKATSTIPIVIVMSGDPGSGLPRAWQGREATSRAPRPSVRNSPPRGSSF